MSKCLAICLIVVLGAACVSEVGEDRDVRDDDAAAIAGPKSGEVNPEMCPLADSELSVQSCLLGAPMNAAGEVALAPTTQAFGSCATYYGSCAGISGCSRAVGGGWQFTACGSWLYAWMTVCNGQPTGWGTGICLW